MACFFRGIVRASQGLRLTRIGGALFCWPGAGFRWNGRAGATRMDKRRTRGNSPEADNGNRICPTERLVPVALH